MGLPDNRDLLRRRILLLAFGLFFILPGIARHDLWNPDEPRYAEVSREMQLTGDYLLPRLNGNIYTQKPPLYFWCVNLAAWVRGSLDETAARLPSALGGIGTLVLVFEIGDLLFGKRAAWISVAALATGFKFPLQAQTGQIDMLLVFFVTLSLYCWIRGERENRPRFHLLFFGIAGLATLAKGPVGLLTPLLSILAFLAIRRDRAAWRRLRLGRGLLVWAATVLIWLVPAGIQGGTGYLRQIILHQNLTRYVNPWHHYRGFYYYLPVILVDFFPWSFLLPSALVLAWRGRKAASGRWILFATCWVAATLVFFSVSPAKRTVYILTMYPGMALIMGAGLQGLACRWPRDRGWLLWPLALAAALAAGTAVSVPWLAAGRPQLRVLSPDLPLAVSLLLGLLALSAALAFFLAWRSGVRQAVVALACGSGLVFLLLSLAVLPAFDPIKSARPLSGELLQRLGPGETYGLYPRLEPPFLFYTKRLAVELNSPEELSRFVARPERIWLLATRRSIETIGESLRLTEVAGDQAGAEGYVLLTRSRP
ncbi:MAG: ArnT family glycosyltransferase [Acidobacteriota bacterium]